MNTLKQFMLKAVSIPLTTSWYLADLGEAKGRQSLYIKQSPQKLKILREHALIESSVSSNRIEGVTVAPSRIQAIFQGKTHLRDRNEEEVRGYRNALKWIHEADKKISVSETTIRSLHRLNRGEIWDAGKYKNKDSDIIEKYPDGRVRIRFKTVSAKDTPKFMRELVEVWRSCIKDRKIHPLIALAAFNLDFLCIHPFRDGNGRVSRLLLLLQCYHLGFDVGRYISLERLIEENKERYYETLEDSSRYWHEGKQDPWPYINYVLFILKTAYQEFEQRAGQIKSPRGAKTELVESAITAFRRQFALSDLERACPGVSHDMIRRVLRDLKKRGEVRCLGRGPGALWEKL